MFLNLLQQQNIAVVDGLVVILDADRVAVLAVAH